MWPSDPVCVEDGAWPNRGTLEIRPLGDCLSSLGNRLRRDRFLLPLLVSTRIVAFRSLFPILQYHPLVFGTIRMSFKKLARETAHLVNSQVEAVGERKAYFERRGPETGDWRGSTSRPLRRSGPSRPPAFRIIGGNMSWVSQLQIGVLPEFSSNARQHSAHRALITGLRTKQEHWGPAVCQVWQQLGCSSELKAWTGWRLQRRRILETSRPAVSCCGR
jgi:hypothetical protein